ILISISAGASFVARCNPKDIEGTSEIIKKAILHKGFSFVEMLQDCLIFNYPDNLEKRMYRINNSLDFDKAITLAKEWDYDNEDAKIPIGIFYQTQKQTLEEKWYKKR
ncbi:MAG: 2-oxoacid:ferredoxin oxidoreductase subunit beta, partial [Candidatus Pacearchaeota archaeon]